MQTAIGYELVSRLVYMDGEELRWRFRTENMTIPQRYINTRGLFNGLYANKAITGDVFKCCGREYDTEDVKELLRSRNEKLS